MQIKTERIGKPKYDCSNRAQFDFLLCNGEGNGLTTESTKGNRDLKTCRDLTREKGRKVVFNVTFCKMCRVCSV